MKTAISLPARLFERAELIALHMGLNRSQRYTQAVNEFLTRHDPAAITASFNSVYGEEPSSLDAELIEMQAASLEQGER